MHVLLIEDSAPDIELLKLRLGRADLEIVQAGTLALGKELLATNGYDVIVLNLDLPDSQGIETLRAMRAVAGSIPIVVWTGPLDEAEEGTLGDAAVVDKDAEPEVLIAAIQRATTAAPVAHHESPSTMDRPETGMPSDALTDPPANERAEAPADVVNDVDPADLTAKVEALTALVEQASGQTMTNKQKLALTLVVLFFSVGGGSAVWALLEKGGTAVLNQPSPVVLQQLDDLNTRFDDHEAAVETRFDEAEARADAQDRRLGDIDTTARTALGILERLPQTQPYRRPSPPPAPEPEDPP